jgi:hypothetical protein
MTTEPEQRDDGRDEAGKFAAGNRHGKGRPARPVEADYLRRLSDMLTPDRWARIVEAAITAAEQGDAKARAWVAGFAVGAAPMSLQDLAALELNELEPLDLTEATAALDAAEARGDFGDAFTRILGRTRPSTLSAAIQRRERDEAARQAEADRRAKAERKAARAAAQAQAEATGAE